MITLLRPYVLGILTVLTAVGLIPPQLNDLIQTHPEAVLAFVLASWCYTVWKRNRKDRLYVQEGAGLKRPGAY